MKLENKVALITGAGSGIGKAMAMLFAAEGAKVVVADVVPKRVDEVVAKIKVSGGAATGVIANVASEPDIEKMVNSTIESFGRLDILCNNAGVMDGMTPAADVTNDLWERVLSINLTGPFLACRKAIPMMIEQGGGVILNTASTAGLHGGHAGTAYTTSKHAVIGLTKSIAYMYAAEGIRCNALCPGGTETAIGTGGEPNEFGMARAQLGMGTMSRVGQPEELAQVALMLVSDDASYVNGVTMVVDGGWTAH